jgi:hypothetical protein
MDKFFGINMTVTTSQNFPAFGKESPKIALAAPDEEGGGRSRQGKLCESTQRTA